MTPADAARLREIEERYRPGSVHLFLANQGEDHAAIRDLLTLVRKQEEEIWRIRNDHVDAMENAHKRFSAVEDGNMEYIETLRAEVARLRGAGGYALAKHEDFGCSCEGCARLRAALGGDGEK